MPKIQLHCHQCGKPYERYPSQAERSRFCSRPCTDAWLNVNVRTKHKAPWLAALNADPKHQVRANRASARARKRKEIYRKTRGRHTHRRVAEQIAGRPLRSDEIVHHVDENKENNDPSNLDIAITRRLHRLTHAWLTRNWENQKELMLRKRKGMVPGMKYRFKTKPFRHQVKALKKMLFNRGGMLFMEMGTGKSKVAIDFACAMYLKQGVDRVVIVCPKSVVSVWKIEIRKHAPDHVREKIRWVIINYDKLQDRSVEKDDEVRIYKGKKHVLKKFLAGSKSLLIADEGHLLKTPSAARSRAVYEMRKEANLYLHLTGTKLTKDVMDLYMQFKIYDDKVFGTNKGHFEKQFCVYGGYGGYQLLRYTNLDKLKKITKPHVFQVMKKDCLDLPNRMDKVIPVKLTGQARRLYDEMAMDQICTLDDGTVIETDNVLVQRIRLRQISSGFISDENKKIYEIGDDKERKLQGRLADWKSQEIDKGVIFCQWSHDVKTAARIASEKGYKFLLFHGGTSEQEREQHLIEFDETDEPTMFVTQIAAGSLGISLTASANAIFYSLTDNYAQTAQARDRLHRIGQHSPVTYEWLVAPGIDEAIMLGNQMKKSVDELLLKNPHLLMKAGFVK